jgi:ABC-type uncharacterized transport system permease subunit
MLNHLSWEVTDIIPAIMAMFVMCMALAPFLFVGTALASWRKQRKLGRTR